MLKKFQNSLENSRHPLLGPNLWGLKKCGLLQSNTGISKVLYNLIHIAAVIFVFSQYLELWLIRSDLNMALQNLSFTMLSSICVIKAGTFVYFQKDWKDILDYVSETERWQLSTKNVASKAIIQEYIRYSRHITYMYWGLVTITVFIVTLAPYVVLLSSAEYINNDVPYPEIMSSWLPFNKFRGFGYWVMLIEQTLICFYGGGIVANYDSNSVVLMTFFSGQLKVLSENCTKIFGEGSNLIHNEEALQRLRDCHSHHLNLTKYAKKLNVLLSPVMFMYVIICSLMICANAIQLAADGVTPMQQIWIAEYLIALITQLFLYSWHSNNVFAMSERVCDGVYQSLWWARPATESRWALLLSGQLQKRIIFNAGPFTMLTVSTFVSILKGSYSYYTLLSKKE